jgi:BolA-like protein 1
MNRESRLFQALQNLNPTDLFIENESHLHGSSKDGESHFKVLIVSEKFSGLSRIERHQKVNLELTEEFGRGLHALSLRALTPEEFEKMSPQDFKSPECAHKPQASSSESF